MIFFFFFFSFHAEKQRYSTSVTAQPHNLLLQSETETEKHARGERGQCSKPLEQLPLLFLCFINCSLFSYLVCYFFFFALTLIE